MLLAFLAEDFKFQSVHAHTHVDLWGELSPDGVEVLRVPDGGEGARRAVLRRAEHELGAAEVLVHVVGQRDLCVRERVEDLLVLGRDGLP